MPDVSNEELKRLIQHVIIKMGTMETKLDLLLDESINRSKVEPKIPEIIEKPVVKEPTVFRFSPINDDTELEVISRKIEEEKGYKKELLNYLKCKRNLKLEDIFSVHFLVTCNYQGHYGKQNLEKLVPFQEIYCEIFRKKGKTDEDIKKMAISQLYRVKNRIRMAKHRNSEKYSDNVSLQKEEIEESSDENEDLEDDEELCSVEYLEEEEFLVEIEEIGEEEMMRIPIEIVEVNSVEENAFFTPISNDSELKHVTYKIQTDPLYLKNLRLKLLKEYKDGPCCLEQLFSCEFLRNINLGGVRGNGDLKELLPYQEVYCYLKRHMGQSEEEIEEDAKKEMRKLKNRLYTRDSSKRSAQIKLEKRRKKMKTKEHD